MKNRPIVFQMIGRTITTTPRLPHTPDNTCIQKSTMKTMRTKELLSTKPSVLRRIHFYIIPLGKERIIDRHSWLTIDRYSTSSEKPETCIDQHRQLLIDRRKRIIPAFGFLSPGFGFLPPGSGFLSPGLGLPPGLGPATGFQAE
ncbi:hypothetical protein F2Q69_00018901 [Brassica cretica]|uniref:Uncharacterized protein n=1 Tax=Brassica cretica TaxID=69181 RepID=A0A8S9QAQ9_BRACR|nr:hypothetical protein F2Q69_00018901 [Brassica cretica]